MATLAKKLITAEEFLLMPDPGDGFKRELVRGVIVMMSPAGGRHGVCCAKIIRRVGFFVDAHELGHVMANDTGFVSERGPDTVRAPDIGFWSRERLPNVPVGFVDIPPDLAIEVVSPFNTVTQMRRRVRDFLAKGVRLVWVIDPENRTATVYRTGEPPRELEETDTLIGEDVLPGFTCKVAEMLP